MRIDTPPNNILQSSASKNKLCVSFYRRDTVRRYAVYDLFKKVRYNKAVRKTRSPDCGFSAISDKGDYAMTTNLTQAALPTVVLPPEQIPEPLGRYGVEILRMMKQDYTERYWQLV